LRDYGYNFRRNYLLWSKDFGLILAEAAKIKELVNGQIKITHTAIGLGGRGIAGLLMPAGNIVRGFMVPILENDQIVFDEVISVKKEYCAEETYDLDIETYHNYIAEGVMVHNSIFGWASGDPTLMLDFPCDEQITLHQSHRCSRAVHDLARTIVEKRFQTRYPDDDFTPTDTQGEVMRGRPSFDNGGSTFYLFRTRYLLNLAYDELLAKGIPFITRKGKLSPLDDRKGSKKSAVKALYGLYNGERVALSDLGRLIKYIPGRGFIEHGQKAKLEEYCLESAGSFVMASNLLMLGFTLKFVEALKSEPFGVLSPKDFPDSHKSYLLDVIETHGPEILDTDIPLCLSTCHSAKGLEADSVVLCPDYTAKPWRRLIGNDEEEHRLAYVAVTRARNRVVVLPPSKTQYYPI